MRALITNLGEECKQENACLSSLPPKGSAYRKILELGVPAVPFILELMAVQSEWHWICALSNITGEHPFPESSAGRFDEITLSWLEWGRKKGLLLHPSITFSRKQAHELLVAKFRMFGTDVISNLCERNLMAADWKERLMKEPKAIISTQAMDAVDLDPVAEAVLDLFWVE